MHWEPGVQYNVGDEVKFEGDHYRVIQAHRSQSDWPPNLVPALFQREQGHGGQHEGHRYEQEQQFQQQEHPSHHQHHQEQQQQEQHEYGTIAPAHHSWNNMDESTKHEIELGGGLLAGLGAIGAGYYAYHEHGKTAEQKKALTYGLSNWLKEAKERQQHFYERGPSAPVTWILNEGYSFPRSAIQGGEENGTPYWISRAYFEGGVHPGKTSSHYEDRASFACDGREVSSGTFEVLIGESMAIRWVKMRGPFNLHALGHRPVIGGHAADGKPFFIAQGLVGPDKIIPGKVMEGVPAVFGENEREVSTEEYMVLCYA